MLVERIWSGNSLRNFHYLIACPEAGEDIAATTFCGYSVK